MLRAAKVPLFFWAEVITTACFTQNRSLVIPRHEKTPYHISNDQKPPVKFFHIFGSICYIVRDGENLDKMKEKGDECIFVGYSTQSRAYRVFNKRTRVIMESIHVNFDKLPQMVSDHVSSDPDLECQSMALKQDTLSPAIQRQENVPQVDTIVTTSNELDLLFSLMVIKDLVTRPLTHIPLRAILGVLQIGIRAEAIENHVKNVLLDYNHFQNIALVQKGLHGTFMHMLVAALVDTIMSDSEDSSVTYTTVSSLCEGRSGDVSPGVDGPPVMPEDPYAYVVAAFQALPLPDYVPGPEEPEQAPPSPIYIPYVPKPVHPEYIPESDLDEDLEDNDEDPKEDPADYSADHDDDEEEEEPSGDDADKEDEEQDEDDDD
nr:hypothetical protein [Tanacetum cinerariifolium]